MLEAPGVLVLILVLSRSLELEVLELKEKLFGALGDLEAHNEKLETVHEVLQPSVGAPWAPRGTLGGSVHSLTESVPIHWVGAEAGPALVRIRRPRSRPLPPDVVAPVVGRRLSV